MSLKTSDAIARIDRMIPLLYQNIVNALRIEATMEAGNKIVQGLPDKQVAGAEAYNTIMQSLAFDLSMHLARLYDVGTKHRPVNQRDVASIPLLVRLLRQERCKKTLMLRARKWAPHNMAYASVFERDCEKALARASAAYSKTFKGAFGRSGLKNLKAFRDTLVAHTLMTDVDQRPMYNQLFRLTDCARDFVEHARLAVTGDNSSLAEFEEIYEGHAEAFWRKALLGKDTFADDDLDAAW